MRQILRAHGFPIRSIRDTHALQRARRSRENAELIIDHFRDSRDVDIVARELKLPKKLVAQVVEQAFTPAERRKQRRARKKYSDNELVEFLQAASRSLGGVLSAQAYTQYARGQETTDGRPWPTHQTHALRFGSWREAVTAAGLTANAPSPIAGQTIFENGHCIDALRAAARSLGHAPTAEEYDNFARASNGALPSQATVRHRLGGWYRALSRSGL